MPYSRYLKESLLAAGAGAGSLPGWYRSRLFTAFGRVGWWSLAECAAVFAVAWVTLAAILWRREPALRTLTRRVLRFGRQRRNGTRM